MDAYGNQNGSQHPYIFFIFLETPYNTDKRVVTSVGGLCFGLFYLGTFGHRATPGTSDNMSGISCLCLRSERLTRQ
jgi:hypothetical protein